MLGLRRWKSGASLIDGTDIRTVPARTFWQRVGYVPQAKPASFIYSVLDMVMLGRSARLGLFAKPSEKDREAAFAALTKTGIAHLADKLTNEISGGEYQLVLIARALAGNPELLVLDEPESNLDFKNQLRVLMVLRELSETLGIGAVINTHFPAHALEISTKTLVLMPDGTHRFGFTHDVLTEETLSESFGVGVKILPVTIPERPDYVCVAAFDAAPERKQ